MSQEKYRTFICVEIPASVRERIANLQRELRSIDAQVSWVRSENIHLTLKFLGDVERDRVAEVVESVRLAAEVIAPFEIEIGGAGCFPSPRNPRVLWVGFASVPDPLRQLHSRIEDLLARRGFAREEKKFSPHLTIGRIRAPRGAARVAESLIARGFDPESFVAHEVIVMRSELGAGGSVYTPQSFVKLGGAQP
jgi:2'-5' RNA ligase